MLYLFSVSWGNVSGWWTIACLLLGLLYSFLLYRQPITISKIWRNLLFTFRTITVFILTFLLLAPLFKTVNKHLQKPLILIAEDNSASVKLFPSKNYKPENLVEQLNQLKKTLGDDYEVHEYNFSKTIADGFTTTFGGKQTDIAQVFTALNSRFVNQNIGAVILASDGLYNRGNSPVNEAQKLKTNIYTIALGDTTPKRDVLIDHINYNKTAFLGNDFNIEVAVSAYQTKGENLKLQVLTNGNLVAEKVISINLSDFKKTIPIKLNAAKEGLQKYQISLRSVANEISVTNNTETIYVEVLDNRKKILILYNSPHPDIAAIRQSLESNERYEIKTSLISDFKVSELSNYNVLILAQLPGNNANMQGLLTQSEHLKIPVWFMLGAQTNVSQFNLIQKAIMINSNNQGMQEVFAAPDASFTSFILSDSAKIKIQNFPPLLAPFGNYSFAGSTSVLLKQKIGSVSTSYPLLAFAENDNRRIAVLAGEGLWHWKLNEFQQYGNHHTVDELLSQAVQYLSAKNDHKQFTVSPVKPVFDEDENLILNAELYNKTYELVNQPDVAITVKNKNGKTYSYQFSRNGKSYELDAGNLPPGEYSYEAKTKLGNENFKAVGIFNIKTLIAEASQSAADHQLLYLLAKQSGGEMVFPDEINRLVNLIRKNENIKTIAYQDSTYHELVDEKWIFALLLLLLSTEWFLRRRNGEV